MRSIIGPNGRAQLPVGAISEEEYLAFYKLRTQEITAEAYVALGGDAAGMSSEEVLSVFYRTIINKDVPTTSTD